MAAKVGSVPLSVHPRSFAFGLAAALSFVLAPQVAVAQQPTGIGPIVVEGDRGTFGTLSGAQIRPFDVLQRDPSDPEHAFDPITGRNFHWDADAKQWIDSQTGQSVTFVGYVSSSPPTSAGPIVVEGDRGTFGTLSGAQIRPFDVLQRDPSDPEHAFDPITGRNFHWDSDAKQWIDSRSGQSVTFVGYLTSAPAQAGQPQAAPPAQIPPPPTPSPGAALGSVSNGNGSALAYSTQTNTSANAFTLELRGFGGAAFINGNTVGTSGFDGAVLFPLGNRVLVGPTAGFQWVASSIVSKIGSQQPGTTFINTSVGFKQGNFGGALIFPLVAPHPPSSVGWLVANETDIGIRGGVTVADSRITQATGFCGLGNATSPGGCTVFSKTTSHDTVVGPYVGGYISHSIFPHVGVFVGYDYHFGLKDRRSNPTNPSGPRTTVFDAHYSELVFGLDFGRW